MPADDTVDPGGSYSWSVTANDPDNFKDPLSFTLVSVNPTPSNNFTALTVDATTGEISWNPTCDDIADGIDTVYTVTVAVSDGCDSVQGSFEVTLYAEPCEPCESTDLSFFSLEVKEGGSWTEYLGDFDPSTLVYNVMTTNFAEHFVFTVDAECVEEASLYYNWYRGISCTDNWLTGESGNTGELPSWIPITSGGTYPTAQSDRPICNKGGNILFIKVTNTGSADKIYQVNVDKPNP